MSDWYSHLQHPAPVPPGTRIKLIHMGDDPDPIEPGALGTVTGGSGAQLFVDWDNGRSLILALPYDTYEVVS
jgi:Domain of unknown function (DUF4314)